MAEMSQNGVVLSQKCADHSVFGGVFCVSRQRWMAERSILGPCTVHIWRYRCKWACQEVEKITLISANYDRVDPSLRGKKHLLLACRLVPYCDNKKPVPI